MDVIPKKQKKDEMRCERNQFVLIGEQNSWRLPFELGRQYAAKGAWPRGLPDLRNTKSKKKK